MACGKKTALVHIRITVYIFISEQENYVICTHCTILLEYIFENDRWQMISCMLF